MSDGTKVAIALIICVTISSVAGMIYGGADNKKVEDLQKRVETLEKILEVGKAWNDER